jgi:hypothetical protein
MHTAVASPQEMEKRWNIHSKVVQNGRKLHGGLIDSYPNLIPTEVPGLEDHKPSDLHASAEIVQFLINAFKERKKERLLKIQKNRDKKTTPLDLVKDYLDPKNVENYKGKEKESYEKHKEEYMRIRDLLQKTLDDIKDA